MRDRSIQAIHTIYFPSVVHRNISGPLQDALSGEFAAPFVTIPLQPWTLHELLPQVPESDAREGPSEYACLNCRESGNTFKCEGMQKVPIVACPRHWSQEVAIQAYRRDIAGYLEWKPYGDGELMR